MISCKDAATQTSVTEFPNEGTAETEPQFELNEDLNEVLSGR